MQERYAKLLRERNYALRPFFRALFTDPEFYSPQVMGNRITSPVEWVVSTARRLGVQPPGEVLAMMAGNLGQELFAPPNVKGWEGDQAWVTTATFLQRGNFARYLINGFSPQLLTRDIARPDLPDMGEEDAMRERQMGGGEGAMEMRTARQGAQGMLRGYLIRQPWRPKARVYTIVERAGAKTPEEICAALCEALLAVPATAEARASIVGLLKAEKPEDRRSERVLRRVAHVVLSLPEAWLD